MVRITNYIERKTEEGKKFFVLEIEGKPTLKTSKTTGNHYLSVRKTTLPTTFGEETAKSLVGTTLQGSIIKVDVEAFEMINTETGEINTLTYKYVYSPEEDDSDTDFESTPKAMKELVEEGVMSL